MATQTLTAGLNLISHLNFDANSRPISTVRSSTISFKSTADLCRKPISLRRSAAGAASVSGSVAPAIAVTDNALNHLNKMRSEKNEDLCLRIGVKQGGCSGMSYTMEFENRANTRPDDSIMEYNGFVIGLDGTPAEEVFQESELYEDQVADAFIEQFVIPRAFCSYMACS